MFNTRKTLIGLAAVALVIGFSVATAEAQVRTSYIFAGQVTPNPYYGTQIYYGPVYPMPYWRSGVGMYVRTGYPYVRPYTPRTNYEARPRTSYRGTLPENRRVSSSDIHDIRPRTAPPKRLSIY